MMIRPPIYLPIILCLLALPPIAAASEEDEASSRAEQSCLAQQEACYATCREKHPEDDPALMGCQARCTTDRAACEAVEGYNAAKPWLEEQAERIKRFLDGFINPQSPPPRSPEGKKKPEEIEI